MGASCRSFAKRTGGLRYRRSSVRCSIAAFGAGAEAGPVAETKAMANMGPTLVELDQRIAAIRENIRELVEQAAAFSGAADDELVSQRIADQQARLDRLTKEREAIVRQKK